MEPLSDRELNQLLEAWEAPPAPAAIEAPREEVEWWRWLVRGTIRVPVPVGIAALAILLFAIFWSISSRPPRAVTLSDFQPVKKLQPRIIRSNYEDQ
ncbi:MAG TPA: hypothetical protein VGL72_13875 [Bryobacteraceae bacterium]|jgi:hypothetical protein